MPKPHVRADLPPASLAATLAASLLAGRSTRALGVTTSGGSLDVNMKDRGLCPRFVNWLQPSGH